MKKLQKILAAVILCCSMLVATPLLAQNDTRYGTQTDRHDDDSGKWGLVGLIGLIGLIGFRKRDEYNRTRTTTRNP